MLEQIVQPCSTCLCERYRSVAVHLKSNQKLRQSVLASQALQFLRDLQIVHRDIKPGSQATPSSRSHPLPSNGRGT